MPTRNPVKIIDHGWNRIREELQRADGVRTRVGLPAEGEVAQGPATTMSELVQVGVVHEFGAPKAHIPERSFLRAAYDENKVRLDEVKKREYNNIIDGKYTAREAIGRVGEWMTGRVKAKIRKGPFAPLKPETVARKKSEKPLIDTGQMIQSITHVETG